MFGQVLITPTLLDSMEFAKGAPPSWKQRAMKDFVAKIKREKVKYPAWVAEGQKFERDVQNICKTIAMTDSPKLNCSDLFMKVVDEVKGGTFQCKLKKNMKVGEDKAFYFGYSDVEKSKETIDIKTTIDYKGPQKYLGKWQHKLYLWMNGKEHFKYVVAVWKSETEFKLKDVKIVEYNSPGEEALAKEIAKGTEKLFEFIREQGLWDDYYFTFSKN